MDEEGKVDRRHQLRSFSPYLRRRRLLVQFFRVMEVFVGVQHCFIGFLARTINAVELHQRVVLAIDD